MMVVVIVRHFSIQVLKIKIVITLLCLGVILFLITTETFALEAFDCARNSDGTAIPHSSLPACQSIDTGALGFKIPSLGDILTFAIRAFFAIAGIAALFYMLIGAFGWVTSGGDKDAISAAREKIQAAIVGMILIVAVLALIWTLEQVIFKRRICLGLSCPVTLPGLIESTDGRFCCVCLKNDGTTFGDRIDAYQMKCDENGNGVAL